MSFKKGVQTNPAIPNAKIDEHSSQDYLFKEGLIPLF